MSKITLADHMSGIATVVKTKVELNEAPKMGLSALFPEQTYKTKGVAVSVKRNARLVAVDVKRCTDPIHNTFDIEKSKLYIPPYFRESFDFTQCQRYDVTFGYGQIPTKVDAGMMASEAAENVDALQNKINRAIELQRAQALQTGIVTLKNGDSIDFGRKAESIVTLTSTAKWDAPTTADPLANLRTAGAFLRANGAIGGTLNAIFGASALSNFLSNPKVQAEADFKRIDRISLVAPVFNKVTGMAYHGQVSIGDFNLDIWTYADSYEANEAGVLVAKPYIDANNVIITAENFKGETSFGSVPAVFEVEGGNAKFISPVEAKFYLRNYVDQRKMAWWFEVASAPIAVPVSVDLVYTIKTA